MKYTIKDFRADFPTDAACLAFIFNRRYPNGLECPKCQRNAFKPVTGRRSYVCPCGFQVYPTEGTIFHKSPTSLTSWFHAIFLMSQSKNGVSAKEIERQIGVTYKCAWRIAKQIRKLMGTDGGPLGGIVEVDETFIGGRKKGRGNIKGKHTPVLGAVCRETGEVRLQVIPDTKTESQLPFVLDNVAPGSRVMTDSAYAFRPLHSLGYTHRAVKHVAGEYVRGDVHTNTIEGFWSQLKRSITGTYHSVSPKHLPSYLDEFSFRYSHRGESVPLALFSRVGRRA